MYIDKTINYTKMGLQKQLLELKRKVDNHLSIENTSEIKSLIELSGDIEVPYQFTCEALHPGMYKGFVIEEGEIIKAQNTIFESNENFHNYEINKDHKNSRKENSSVSDLVGKIINATYDYTKKAYILTGEIYDKEIALKVARKLIKYVSLRINPQYVEEINSLQYARDLKFEEMSFVRVPGDPDVKIY